MPRLVVGALATAGASMANAATVQITFANNVVAHTAGGGLSNFSGDLTGNGVPVLAAVSQEEFAGVVGKVHFDGGVGGTLASGYGSVGLFAGAKVGAVQQISGNGDVAVRAVFPLSFSDPNVNGGSVTAGWLDLTAMGLWSGGGSVRINRLIFDVASTLAPDGVDASSPAFPEFGRSQNPPALACSPAAAATMRLRE